MFMGLDEVLRRGPHRHRSATATVTRARQLNHPIDMSRVYRLRTYLIPPQPSPSEKGAKNREMGGGARVTIKRNRSPTAPTDTNTTILRAHQNA